MSEFTVDGRAVPCWGKCYIICEGYSPLDFSPRLKALLKRMKKEGAKRFYFASRDKALGQAGDFTLDGFSFVHYSDFYVYEHALGPEEGRVFRRKRLSPANAQLFCALHNEAFMDIPNGLALDELQTQRFLEDGYEAGFFMVGGEPYGLYVLDLTQRVPEIASLCILSGHRGEGWGTVALRTLERRLLELNHAQVRLVCAEANLPAVYLYGRRGYQRTTRLSRWYILDPMDMV